MHVTKQLGCYGIEQAGIAIQPGDHQHAYFRAINYGLYCQIPEQVFSDGVLHQFDVPADAEVRPILGGW